MKSDRILDNVSQINIIREFLRKIVYIKKLRIFRFGLFDASREKHKHIPADCEIIFIAYKLLFISQRIIFIACSKLLQVFLLKIFIDTMYADHGTDCIAIAL